MEFHLSTLNQEQVKIILQVQRKTAIANQMLNQEQVTIILQVQSKAAIANQMVILTKSRTLI